MNNPYTLPKKIVLAAALVVSAQAQAALITFDDNALTSDSFFAPQDNASFNSAGTSFDHTWSYDCCWGNFTYSNKQDTTTVGFTNDRSAITGTGVGIGQDNYAVSYSNASINFAGATQVESAFITNTTYAYLAIKNGDDGYGAVKGAFEAGDFFNLTINGLDQNENIISTFDFALADGSDVVDSWTLVDFSSLGTVYGLSFSYSSSDVGDYGINTPTYFAIDNINIQAVPVPASALLFLSALAGLAIRKVRS
ncbi:DUF4465 domain-containing protein [Pseudomonadales bacterium]|nr:DUF4465 domain-containing protein [Pseudomonadales bacterium]